jgi:hypothetical protein
MVRALGALCHVLQMRPLYTFFRKLPVPSGHESLGGHKGKRTEKLPFDHGEL